MLSCGYEVSVFLISLNDHQSNIVVRRRGLGESRKRRFDFVAQAGSGLRDTDTLHRIDPAAVKAEVQQAGFQFVGESRLLANPADDHTKKVFDPSIRGHTDQFIYKFRKPG